MTQPRLSPIALAIGLSLALAAPAGAREGVSGPYLAGRLAMSHHDYTAASSAFTRALLSDSANPQFLESAIVARIALGDVARALPMLKQLDRTGVASQAAAMLTLAELAREGRFGPALTELDEGRSSGRLVDGLYRAWALIGDGRMSDATSAFDEVGKLEGLAPFASYHKALALASVGDFEGADAIFTAGAADPISLSRRGLIARAQILSQLDRAGEAADLIDGAAGADSDPLLHELSEELAAGRTLPFTVVSSPRDGIAEVFFTVAAAMQGDSPDPYALAYARLAAYIRPGHVDAILLSASILETQGQYDLATDAYNDVPREDPAYTSAELGRAASLILAGRADAAIEALNQLAKSFPTLPRVWISLGDTLRREERYAEAAGAYDKAIALFRDVQPQHWPVFYARGIANERVDNWAAAEADFRKSLQLNPDQPQVLNYLGYSFVEKGENLGEALGMIERAEKAEPQSGYIVDSLGWALYRLGRYGEAVGHMERAVALMPVDSVVNDHLGDVYWAVGRKLEAEFQWRRALSFEPEDEEEAARIRRKIEVGLDTVLKEEGAPPLSVSADGG
ncbi:MAG: tetratricopeptide repeat protein [Paracoccaceae bacterium]